MTTPLENDRPTSSAPLLVLESLHVASDRIVAVVRVSPAKIFADVTSTLPESSPSISADEYVTTQG